MNLIVNKDNSFGYQATIESKNLAYRGSGKTRELAILDAVNDILKDSEKYEQLMKSIRVFREILK